MNKKYLFPFVLLLLISATKLTVKNNYWNFKDYDRIEYDFTMTVVNEVNYLEQKNGLKVNANLVLDILDSTYANLIIVNKKIIEKINDSIITYDKIELENEILYESYSNKGEVKGNISDNALALKDILFPILESELQVGDSITKRINIPFDFGEQVLDFEGKNQILKTKSKNGINTYSSSISSPFYQLDDPMIHNMAIYLDGGTTFKFDTNKGVFLNEQLSLNIHIKGELVEGKSVDLMTFKINQKINLKNIK